MKYTVNRPRCVYFLAQIIDMKIKIYASRVPYLADLYKNDLNLTFSLKTRDRGGVQVVYHFNPNTLNRRKIASI